MCLGISLLHWLLAGKHNFTLKLLLYSRRAQQFSAE